MRNACTLFLLRNTDVVTMLLCKYFVLFLTLFTLVQTQSDVYQITLSSEKMESLLQTQKNVVDSLSEYLRLEDRRIKILKGYLNIFATEHKKAMLDREKYLNHPINAFTLIKRLSTDYDYVKLLATVGATNYEWNEKLLYPKQKDMAGAAVNLARVQDTYKLNATHLAEGRLVTKSGLSTVTDTFSPMTSSDCFNLGVMLVKERDYEMALNWFMEALHKFSMEDGDINPFSAADIISFIVKSYHYLGKRKEALFWAKKLRILSSTKVEYDPITSYYKKGIVDEEQEKALPTDGGAGKKRVPVKNWKLYGELCRQEIAISDAASSKLFCSYLRRNPFLLLAPIKTEQILRNPDIFLFHEVLSQAEMDALKKTAMKKKLNRARVHTAGKNKNQIHASESRISASSWLQDTDLDIVERISKRVQDFTGFDLTSSEALQVGYYGIGGYYNPHYDFDRTGKFYKDKGNRIATVMFYLSDVTQGGATVFIRVGLSVTPRKGSAVYWSNLLSSGKGDNRTLHAGCPVLMGAKWVANKWIHVFGQELIRPCPLVEETLPSKIPMTFKKAKKNEPKLEVVIDLSK